MEEMIARRNQEGDKDSFASDVHKVLTEENEACVDSDDSGTISDEEHWT